MAKAPAWTQADAHLLRQVAAFINPDARRAFVLPPLSEVAARLRSMADRMDAPAARIALRRSTTHGRLGRRTED